MSGAYKRRGVPGPAADLTFRSLAGAARRAPSAGMGRAVGTDQFLDWLAQALETESTDYAVGMHLRDGDAPCGIPATCDLVMAAYRAGLVYPVQQRISARSFRFIAIRSSRPLGFRP